MISPKSDETSGRPGPPRKCAHPQLPGFTTLRRVLHVNRSRAQALLLSETRGSTSPRPFQGHSTILLPLVRTYPMMLPNNPPDNLRRPSRNLPLLRLPSPLLPPPATTPSRKSLLLAIPIELLKKSPPLPPSLTRYLIKDPCDSWKRVFGRWGLSRLLNSRSLLVNLKNSGRKYLCLLTSVNVINICG